MRNPASIHHINQYARYATGAARAEREGRYADAAGLWLKAQISPCEASGRVWAMKRREYCLSASRLSWGG